MSKGSKQRPVLDRNTFDNNWEVIFSKNTKELPDATEEKENETKSTKEL